MANKKLAQEHDPALLIYRSPIIKLPFSEIAEDQIAEDPPPLPRLERLVLPIFGPDCLPPRSPSLRTVLRPRHHRRR